MPPQFRSHANLRPLANHEQLPALQLWGDVFGREDGYFARYYDADPWYQEGDSLGAWVGDTLASAVHLCRRPLSWQGGTLLCGGIANVATRPEFRGQGLSRRLLTLAIERMETIGCDFSLLGTGIPSFYAALGWELIRLPRFQLTRSELDRPSALSEAALPSAELAARYAIAPRPLQLQRSRPYDRWIGWHWRSKQAEVLALPGGYAVVTPADLNSSDTADHLPAVSEWRAADAATEQNLLANALVLPLLSGHSAIAFAALPQFLDLDALEPLGQAAQTVVPGQMIRRIGLSASEYDRVKSAYVSGLAASWPADGF